MKKKSEKQEQVIKRGFANNTGDVVMNGRVIGKLYAPYSKSVLKPNENEKSN